MWWSCQTPWLLDPVVVGPSTDGILCNLGHQRERATFLPSPPQVLKCRKGFAKMALLTGAHLVPVLAFGETDLFDVSLPAEGTLWHRVQQLVLKLTGFGIPSISGAGFWDGEHAPSSAASLCFVCGAKGGNLQRRC
eukprot:366536-Chlamydomonas_euryale.AAC.1